MRKDEMEIEELKVPGTANPTSEIRTRWAWVEPLVWTDRMLWALENGVSGVEGMANQCLLRETRAVLIKHSLNGSYQSSKEVYR